MTTPPIAYKAQFDNSKWFRHDRFGMFVHWGVYAVPARGEWVRSIEKIPFDEYQEYVDAFRPERFDAEAWAASAVKAGMKYAVLTAKHHDGYCLFDSELTEYSSQHEFDRDLVREFLDAFRAAGLKVGLYYSLIDWSRPEYPHFDDPHHPMRGNPEFETHVPDVPAYTEYLHGQVRELCSNYGELDILWFDFSYGEMAGETWRATELMAMVRELQPSVIVDNRLESHASGYGSMVTATPTAFAGDFASPEQFIPARGLSCDDGSPLPWEACITLNNNWGYVEGAGEYKDTDLLIRTLIECAAKGGNLLLNVGPDAHGEFPDASKIKLAEVGEWVRTNSESIFGAGACAYAKPDWGYYTQRDNFVYAHVLLAPIGPLCLTGGLRAEDIVSISLLDPRGHVRYSHEWVWGDHGDAPYVQFGDLHGGTYSLPDKVATVVKIELRTTVQK